MSGRSDRVARGRRWTFAAIAAAVVVSGSCSSADPVPDGASETTAAPVTLPATTVVETDGTTTIVEAPFTFPPDADAEQVVAELGPRLPMIEAERACVVAGIGANPDLLGRIGGGVSPGTELFDEVTAVLQRCTVTVTQAPMFAASLNQQVGGTLAPEQLTCLSDGFAALTPGQLDAAMVGALSPADPGGVADTEPLSAVVTGCGVEVPA